MISGFIFVFGLFVGSFLNVCVWRMPAQEQVVKGRSHCRSCKRTIPWYDNIPLISFARLKGKCRFCGAKIALSYPMVELLTGLLFLGVWLYFGPTARGFLYAALGAALILISFIDLKHMMIPDAVTMPGLGIGLLASALFPSLHGVSQPLNGLALGVLGAVIGAGVMWLTGAIGGFIFKQEAMGGGDVKLMAMAGSLIGWQKTLLTAFLLAPILGSAVGLVMKFKYKQNVIPYGPFLSLGTLIAAFWGEALITWYRGLISF